MKVLTFVMAFLAIACPEPLLFANDDLVKIHYKGSDFLARQLVKGNLNLFVSNQYEKKKVFGPRYRHQKIVYVKRYFLKFRDQIEKLSPYNYKRILRRCLPNAPALHRRLGKPGFRYENIPSIIRFYNEFRIQELDVPDPDNMPVQVQKKRD
ncbi:hypothetical protein [Flavilitoribacter nigricans]|uniref:Uncharacterized protein n=1 Tax=Flavilitoribacter nigricans (strain ATCC 23147 / DSM 23189 / NBRC 102662 / NCIMB 1420 / SS-2) TaxID=1122177 RepID=A0A2D0NF70_FLAN2|nr:hypothetical protein [Flavilitoribacter nigricans]PHN07117.1 hypothetical protein CRP01_07770 [Flavilitoribacter nigricans DSM 23189 = NBRC 102662]